LRARAKQTRFYCCYEKNKENEIQDFYFFKKDDKSWIATLSLAMTKTGKPWENLEAKDNAMKKGTQQ
jgi:hypothetical protein